MGAIHRQSSEAILHPIGFLATRVAASALGGAEPNETFGHDIGHRAAFAPASVFATPGILDNHKGSLIKQRVLDRKMVCA